MDLPGFSVMPAGLDDWEPIWKRREFIPTHPRAPIAQRRPAAPRPAGRRACAPSLGSRRRAACPRRATTSGSPRACSRSGSAAPAATTSVRCLASATPTPTRSGPTSRSSPTRAAPAAVASAQARPGSKRESPAVPAQHLLTCTNGHLDEFPYTLWVHRGGKCPKAELPDLKMRDANVGKSVGSTIVCAVLRGSPRYGRGPGRSRTREAPAEVPWPAPPPERVRRRAVTPDRR